jgi:hypothetical protein
MHAVAAVAAEALIATVAGECHGHVLAGQLADAVGRDRRAVGIGLVVQAGQFVDQVEIVALDGLDAVVGLVPVRHGLRELGFVECRIVEGDRAGVDRLVGQAGHGRDHRAGIDTADRKAPSGTSAIMRSAPTP